MTNIFLNNNCTNEIKGISIILVILGHLTIIPGVFANIGVAIFLILSGFGLVQSYKEKGIDKFIQKRLSKVWLPYFFVTIVWILIDALIYHKVHSAKTIIMSLIGVNFGTPIDPTMWYITYLLMWYFIFFFVFKFRLSLKRKMIIVGLISITLYLLLDIFVPSILIVKYYSICFFMGVVVSVYYDKVGFFLTKNNKVILVISITSITLAMILYLVEKSASFASINLGAIGVISLLSFAHYYSVKNKLFKFFGNISYELYLVEGAFIWNYHGIFDTLNNIWLKDLAYLLLIIILSVCLKKLFGYIFKVIK